MKATLLRLLALAFLIASGLPGRAQTTVAAWGWNDFGQSTVPAGLTGVVAIARGGYHSLALKADGTVASWGIQGQSTVPAGLSGVVSIAGGGGHSLALKADGTVAAWGSMGQSTVPAGLSGVLAIAAGDNHSLALKADGTVAAWGNNFSSQSTVPAGLSGVVAIAAGSEHSLALKADGTVAAWGFYVPGTVPAGLSGVVVIAAGYSHSLALKADGTVAAWGCNDYGESTVPAGLSGVVSIAAGYQYSLALKVDGTVAAWGRNDYGQSAVPADLSGVVAIAAGDAHSLALTGVSSGPPVITASRRWITEAAGARAGTVQFFQRIMATGSPAGYAATGLPAGLTLDTATGVITGAATEVGTFTVMVSATNAAGTGTATVELTVTAMPGFLSPPPPRVEAGDNIQLLALGTLFTAAGLPPGMVLNASTGLITGTPAPGHYSVVLTVSNPFGSATLLWALEIFPVNAWGYNSSGQSTVPAGLSGVVAIAAGGRHSLALQVDGTVAVWGDNSFGQRTVPPGLLSGVVAIAAGGSHSLALKADGTVAAWGYNNFGQRTVPAGLAGVVAIAAGRDHSVALKADGTVAAWGLNSSGQRTVPAGLSGVVGIAAGGSHSLALKADGTVAAWGSNYDSLANNSGQSTVPAGLSGVVGIAAGGWHSLALKADGTVAAWGSNYDSFGNNSGQSTVPAGLSGVVALAGGGAHSLALKADGTVAAWGSYYPYDPLGNNSGQSTVPAGLSGVVALAGGGDHSLALVRLPAAPVAGTLGQALSVNYAAVVAVAEFTATGLPPGLSIHPSTGVISGTPTAAGAWTASITMSNRAQTRTESLSFTILNVAQAAYAAWVAANWPAGGQDSAAGADPDEDGIVNLLEYATGTNPLTAGAARLPVAARDTTGHLTLTLDVPSERAALVTWQAQFADGLSFSPATTAAPQTMAGAPAGMVRLRFTDPQSGPRRFGRLSATVP